MLRLIYNRLFFFAARACFLRYSRSSPLKNKPLVAFDIDNTLAKTRESSSRDSKEEISPRRSLCGAAAYFDQCGDFEVVFMSVRPFRAYAETMRWLRANVRPDLRGPLFFVKTPEQKVAILQECPEYPKKILVDDMSFDVGGEIRSFQRALDEIDSARLKHLGLDFIESAESGTSRDAAEIIARTMGVAMEEPGQCSDRT